MADIRDQLRAMPSSLNDACRTMATAADQINALVRALEEEREYWAGEIASAMIRDDPCDDMQDRCDRITRVLNDVGGSRE